MENNQIQTVPCSNAGLTASMIVPEVLKEDNYERWRAFMEHYLVAQDLWDVVLSIEMPKVEDPRGWVKKNALALHAIKISCGANSFDRIKKMNSAKDAWNALVDLHKQPDENASRGSQTATEVKETCTRILDNNKRAEIVSSLHDGDWDALKNVDRITEIIFPGGVTALHIATTLGHSKIVNELVKIAREDYLEIQDDNGDTALSLAACDGTKEIAECLVQKNDKLLTILNNQGYAPLVVACVNCQMDMASYLYSITQIEFLLPVNSNQGTLFLKYCLLNSMPDVGLDLFLRYPCLAAGREFITITELSNQPSLFRSRAVPFFSIDTYLWYSCLSVAELPSPSDDNTSTRRLEMFNRQVALVEKRDRILRFLFFPFHRSGKLRQIYNLKLTHMYANLVLCHLCKEMSTYRNATQLVESGAVSALFQAIKDGPDEILNEILKANPDLIWCNEKLSRDIVISAILHRQGGILRLHAVKKAIISLRDEDGNNALHLAAKLPDYPFEDGVHAAWAMDREQKWFEEIKSYLPSRCHGAKNHYGETPDEVFKREHHELITEMEKWGKGTSKSYSLASVLIVTVMFAALFTVPGGNDENTGMPILLHRKLFFWFLICDAVSFITASTSFLAFLSVLTLTYTRRRPRSAMPYQMLFAISHLIISTVTMILAFILALTMMLEERKFKVLPAIIIYLLVVFFVMLSSWLVPTISTLCDMTVPHFQPFVK